MPYAGMNAPLILCRSPQTAAEHAGRVSENTAGVQGGSACAGVQRVGPLAQSEVNGPIMVEQAKKCRKTAWPSSHAALCGNSPFFT